MANADVLFSFNEAVKAMGVTPERLEKLIDEGKIDTVSRGATHLIPREAILRYFVEAAAAKNKKK